MLPRREPLTAFHLQNTSTHTDATQFEHKFHLVQVKTTAADSAGAASSPALITNSI